MSDYTKSTNFATKDSLASGNPLKVIKGTEIDDEFEALETVIATKADLASPALTGTPTAPTAAEGDNSTQIATTAFVATNGVPSGCILMWSGSIASIPSGWYLCDGTNGTPNLQNRFVVGAGSTYSVDATGGSADATLVSHSHTTNTTGSHDHKYYKYNGGGTGYGLAEGTGYIPGKVDTDGAGSHSHTISTVGSSATNANLPPYYALAYIMKA